MYINENALKNVTGNMPKNLNTWNLNKEAKPGPTHIARALMPTRIAEYLVGAQDSILTATNFLVNSLPPPTPIRPLPVIKQTMAKKLFALIVSATK